MKFDWKAAKEVVEPGGGRRSEVLVGSFDQVDPRSYWGTLLGGILGYQDLDHSISTISC